ncbi:hypothetical protein ACJJTC_015936 [Scirpophaga incertulas]
MFLYKCFRVQGWRNLVAVQSYKELSSANPTVEWRRKAQGISGLVGVGEEGGSVYKAYSIDILKTESYIPICERSPEAVGMAQLVKLRDQVILSALPHTVTARPHFGFRVDRSF